MKINASNGFPQVKTGSSPDTNILKLFINRYDLRQHQPSPVLEGLVTMVVSDAGRSVWLVVTAILVFFFASAPQQQLFQWEWRYSAMRRSVKLQLFGFLNMYPSKVIWLHDRIE